MGQTDRHAHRGPVLQTQFDMDMMKTLMNNLPTSLKSSQVQSQANYLHVLDNVKKNQKTSKQVRAFKMLLQLKRSLTNHEMCFRGQTNIKNGEKSLVSLIYSDLNAGTTVFK